MNLLGDIMEDIVFKNQEELYRRVLPALRSRRKLLRKDGFKTIKEIDIWDYMRYVKWADSYGLELCDMVDDILNTNNNDVANYFFDKYMPKKTIIEDDFELPKLKD